MEFFLKTKKFINNNKFLLFTITLVLFHFITNRFNTSYLITIILAASLSVFFDKIGHILQYISLQKLDKNIRKMRLDLLKSEAKFRDFFNVSSVPMAIYHLENMKFVSANKKLCELLEYSEKEILSKKINELIYHKDIEDTIKVVKDRLSNKITAEDVNGYTNRYISKNGKIISIAWTSTESYDGLVYCTAIAIPTV
jgi:PAS domain S-box-containing protein